MKILHTSDWHLGHTLYGYDRSEEQMQMLREVAEAVSQEKPDVFLLSGDVYHTPQPSAAAETMLTEGLVKIHEACPDMLMVVTAGNHDSGTRHEVFRTPWRALGVYAVGVADREHPEKHIIELPGRGFVIAVPYVSERNLPDGFFQHLLDMVAERNTASLPVVMMAHTTVRGCDFSGHEHGTEYTVGGIDSVDLEQLGTGYDYLALGHIHHEQFVHTGHHNVRYSGTPLPVSFDECYPHSVSMVSIASHGAVPEVRRIEISNPHPLVNIPSKGTSRLDDALQMLRDFPSDIPAYIRLNVETPDFLPAEASHEAAALTEGKACRFCCINAHRPELQQTDARALTVQEFQAEEPIDIARRYAEDRGLTFTDEMAGMFLEVVRQLHDESRKE